MMRRDELIDLLERGLDEGLSRDDCRAALHALARRPDAVDILREVDSLTAAAASLREACDAAPVPADLMSVILAALDAEDARMRARAPAARTKPAGMIGLLPGLLDRLRDRSAEALQQVGHRLSPQDLAGVAAGRGAAAPAAPGAAVARTDEDAPGDTPMVDVEPAAPGFTGSGAAETAVRSATVVEGVVRFAPGMETLTLSAGPDPVAVDLGGLGPQEAGNWTLHLTVGRIEETHADRLRLSGDAEGLIVLIDGSALLFAGVAVVRWAR